MQHVTTTKQQTLSLCAWAISPVKTSVLCYKWDNTIYAQYAPYSHFFQLWNCHPPYPICSLLANSQKNKRPTRPMHAADFDAYTKNSMAYNNLCEDNGEEGIFVEETASFNVVINNTCRRNGAGISLYSNAVGPVANNFIVNNRVENNRGNGLSAG